MRLIDADKLKSIFQNWIDTKQVEGVEQEAIETCIAVLEDLPTIDPEAYDHIASR